MWEANVPREFVLFALISAQRDKMLDRPEENSVPPSDSKSSNNSWLGAPTAISFPDETLGFV